MAKYTVGIDFGTLSARALVVEVATGRELASATMDYPHQVMTRALPDGTPLKPDWALQHPEDYLLCLQKVVHEAVQLSGVNPDDVIGVGVDFTSNTFMPIDSNGEPLCLKKEFASNPNAWVKLWKHHAAQRYAREIEKIAIERNEDFLAEYGGRVSPEWLLPKLWETLDEAPEVCQSADTFIEAADWIILNLTGERACSSSIAGYKSFWRKGKGYPPKEFLACLDPRMPELIEKKLPQDLHSIGTLAGRINARGAALTGLNPGTAVAVANTDALVAMPPAGLTEPGSMLMIMGTSTCHIMVEREFKPIPGICGVVEDGIIPGLYGYEAGQSCCGDHFKWMTENCVPAAYEKEAEARGIGIHALLTEKAEKLRPGQSGLIALDWWNGNRSVLVDADLTGMILGMTLQTLPEEIYRALIEATAYGSRMILDTFEQNDLHVNTLYACGGISKKNRMMMQIYADVLNREIHIARSAQTPALGGAIFASVAAGANAGGYDSLSEAAKRMGGADEQFYSPIPENVKIYDALYREYAILHDYFGRGGNDVMKRLKALRTREA